MFHNCPNPTFRVDTSCDLYVIFDHVKLIADVGGTTGRWTVINDGNVHSEYKSQGFHPLQQEAASLSDLILHSPLWELKDDISELSYYGTAATIGEAPSIIRDVLGACFPFADIEIFNDIQAIAHASAFSDCIICILGTGSSSAQVKDGSIYSRVSSLGYVIGDEGSGVDMAKRLIRQYFYTQLPSEIHHALENEYDSLDADFISSFYVAERPAALLAQFARFIVKHKTEPSISSIIHNSFSDFYYGHLVNYDAELPIVCSGGIAHNLREEWNRFLESKAYKNITIIEDPIQGLIERYIHDNT